MSIAHVAVALLYCGSSLTDMNAEMGGGVAPRVSFSTSTVSQDFMKEKVHVCKTIQSCSYSSSGHEGEHKACTDSELVPVVGVTRKTISSRSRAKRDQRLIPGPSPFNSGRVAAHAACATVGHALYRLCADG